MPDPPPIDVSSICLRTIQELRRDSVRNAPRPNATNIEIWRRRLNCLRNETNNNNVWKEATVLLAKLKLAQEGLLVVEESEVGEEIEKFLQNSSKQPIISKEYFSPVDELADACLSAERHISIARELISQFDRTSASDEVVNRKTNISSDIEELIKEISTRIEKITSEVKSELNNFKNSE